MPSPLFADRSLAPGGHARVVKPDRPDIILAVVPALFALVRMRGREPFAAEIERLAVGRQSSLRSEEHTSELQSLMRNSYAVFRLKKKTNTTNNNLRTTARQITINIQ